MPRLSLCCAAACSPCTVISTPGGSICVALAALAAALAAAEQSEMVTVAPASTAASAAAAGRSGASAQVQSGGATSFPAGPIATSLSPSATLADATEPATTEVTRPLLLSSKPKPLPRFLTPAALASAAVALVRVTECEGKASSSSLSSYAGPPLNGPTKASRDSRKVFFLPSSVLLSGDSVARKTAPTRSMASALRDSSCLETDVSVNTFLQMCRSVDSTSSTLTFHAPSRKVAMSFASGTFCSSSALTFLEALYILIILLAAVIWVP
mmetsp:Transcript_3920/g.7590  ORF Transcript_3920/g.7590 Transcript_3920/m.7590 type:complete len:269 (-) Transcript_3920:451-1257(-)